MRALPPFACFLLSAVLLAALPGTAARAQGSGLPDLLQNMDAGGHLHRLMELANQPGCYAYLHEEDAPHEWNGPCEDGLATGEGTLSGPSGYEGIGPMRRGKQHGQWVAHDSLGNVAEGPVVEGKQHGRWVWRYSDGRVLEGRYVEDEKHGQWVERRPDGSCKIREWNQGKLTATHAPRPCGDGSPAEKEAAPSVALDPKCPQNRAGCWVELANQPGCHAWVLRGWSAPEWSGGCTGVLASGEGVLSWANGAVEEGSYADGKAQGWWTSRFAGGTIKQGFYADGEKHGWWTLRFDNGTVEEGPYADGKAQGWWTSRFADGTVKQGFYADGKRRGWWTLRFASGKILRGLYVDGRRQGRWIEVPGYVDGRWESGSRWPTPWWLPPFVPLTGTPDSRPGPGESEGGGREAREPGSAGSVPARR